jgi:transposase
LVNIEDLMPQDHLLRKIDATIDFSFIAERTRPLYCEDNGRPCVDPVMLFKMLFIGYLYGIRSERRLVEEVRVNVAYRWFVGLSLTDKVPHATTFSQNRRRRFNGTTIFQEIFDEIVLQAINHGLIEGKELFTDSTSPSHPRWQLIIGKAHEGVAPKWLDHVNERYSTPDHGVLLVAIFSGTGLLVTWVFNLSMKTLVYIPNSLGIATYILGTAAGLKLLKTAVWKLCAGLACLMCLLSYPFIGTAIWIPAIVVVVCLSYMS